MTGLRTHLQDLGDTEAPPSRLSADMVYAAAWRRRRRQAAAWTVAGTLAVAVTVALVLRPGAPAPAPQPAQPRTGPVISVTATDPDHLYAGVRGCDGCPARLVGSDDGGRTWTVIQEDFGDGYVDAPAPGVLLRTTGSDGDPSGATGPKIIWHHHVSLDGGRTWRELRIVDEPVEAAPRAGWFQCAPTSLDGRCRLLAVDPAAGVMAPLANQPDLAVSAPSVRPASSGMWVTGSASGDDFRPAVALTPDRGRTWYVQVFDTTGPAHVALSTNDGGTAYAVVSTDGTFRVHRSTTGGRIWEAVDPGHSLPPDPAYYSDGDTYVASDGTHVVLRRDDVRHRWFASADLGMSYRLTAFPGLDRITVSGMRAPIQVAVPGVFLAFDDTNVYHSTTGLHWTAITVRPPG